MMQASTNLLLGLPREIRDKIYAFSFGDFPLPQKVVCWPYPDYLQAVPNIPTPPIYDTTNKIVNTSVLRICSQIRYEALAMMLKTHQLVCITLVNVLLSPHLIGAMLHIVPLSDEAFATYPGFIMTHRIEGEQDGDSDSPSRPWSFALPWRDLNMFCRAVATGHVFCLDAQCQIRHQITMHDPFANTCSSDYMTPKNQAKYVQTYIDCLGGAAQFEIIGHVDAKLATSLEAEIQKLPQAIDITKMLNKYTRQDAGGQRHLLRRNLAKFSRACLKTLTEVSRLVEADAWLAPGPAGRPNTLVKGVRDIFNVLSREHGDPAWEEDTKEDHTWHMSRAIQAAASLLAGRPPSPAQRSSVYYRNARAHRAYCGSPAAAEAILGLALDMVAGEGFENWKEQCLEEAHEIARWKEIRNGTD